MKILIVEDEPAIASLYAIEAGRHINCDVIDSVASGEEALGRAIESGYDLILLDIMMPGISGVEVLPVLRGLCLNAIIAVITGDINITGDDLPDADVVLYKPFSFEKLRTILKVTEEVVQRRELIQRLAESRDAGPESVQTLLKVTEEIVQRRKLIQGLSALEDTKKGRDGGTSKDSVSKDIEKYRLLCGVIAHDLKGEFTNIGGSIREIRQLTSTAEDIQEECEAIERSVEYSQLLLRRLLEGIEMGRPPKGPVDILEVLRRTELLVRPRLPSSVQLEIVVDRRLKPPVVAANVEQLMAIMIELINNATKALREQGGCLRLSLKKIKGDVAILVKDDGPGIPKELRKILLREQVPSKTGLGLGLFLCRRIVGEFGGKLKLVTSGKGTTVTILLPAATEKKEP